MFASETGGLAQQTDRPEVQEHLADDAAPSRCLHDDAGEEADHCPSAVGQLQKTFTRPLPPRAMIYTAATSQGAPTTAS